MAEADEVPQGTAAPVAAWPTGGGAMGALIRAHDWSRSPLGVPADWSPALRTTVALLLPAEAQIVLFWGADYCALYNDAYAPTIGDKHPHALGRPAREYWAELWDDLRPLLDSVRETGRTVSAKDRPFRIERHGYLEEVFFDISYSPVRADDGAVLGVLCIVGETTGRVRAEAALRASEARQAFLLGLTDRLRALAEPDAILREAADALGERLGAERVGFGEVFDETDLVEVAHNYTDGVPKIEGRYRGDDYGLDLLPSLRAGQTVVRPDIARDPALAAAEKTAHAALNVGATAITPILREGRLRAALFMHHRAAHDYTPDELALLEESAGRTWDAVERARAEMALRESEERFRTMIDAIPLAIWITGATGRVEFLNKHWRDYAGATADFTAPAAVAAAHVHPEDGPRVLAAFVEAMRTSTPFEIQQRNRAADGTYRWFLNRVIPYRDSRTGVITRWLGVGIDIHDRVEADAERERLLAAERAARAEAEEAVRARDAFLSIAAHELRTPLTALKGTTQLLQRRLDRDMLDPARLAAGIRAIDHSAARLIALTDDLLDVARIRTGQLPLALRPVDLAVLATEAVAQARDRLGDGHRLELDLPAALPPVVADAARIEQVLTNLLDNAIKYSPEGGVVAVRATRDGAGVALAVRDPGIGLPTGAAEAIFAPFGRAANAARSNLPGMGLGLFICRSIVERHGGRITATSDGEGRGTTLTVWLPLAGPGES